MTLARPHILDASALVELFSGHQTLMRLLGDADAGDRFVIVPTLAIAEAQAVLAANGTASSACAVWHEARMLNGVIVTRVPEAYGGHEVAIQAIR